jgi:hypothetical protein
MIWARATAIERAGLRIDLGEVELWRDRCVGDGERVVGGVTRAGDHRVPGLDAQGRRMGKAVSEINLVARIIPPLGSGIRRDKRDQAISVVCTPRYDACATKVIVRGAHAGPRTSGHPPSGCGIDPRFFGIAQASPAGRSSAAARPGGFSGNAFCNKICQKQKSPNGTNTYHLKNECIHF